MKMLAPSSLVGLLLAMSWQAAQAQDRLWVASNGSNMNPCTRALPCQTFQEAHNKNSSGGIINCVDAGSYGTVSIGKSITIDCIGTLGTIEPIADGTAVFINAFSARVILRGIAMDGRGFARTGVNFFSGGFLHIDNCRISGFAGFMGTSGIGLSIVPSAGVTMRVHVTDTVINDNGAPAAGGGIVIQPSGTGSARVGLNRVVVDHNTYGVFANGMGSTGPITLQIKDSVVSGSTVNGISAFTAAGQSTTSITVDGSSSLLNGADGILSQGSPAFVLLGRSTVMSNVTGLRAQAGGSIFSYQNNQLSGNVTDGAPTMVLAER